MNILNAIELGYQLSLINDDIQYFKNYKNELINFMIEQLKTKQKYKTKTIKIIDELNRIDLYLLNLKEQKEIFNKEIDKL